MGRAAAEGACLNRCLECNALDECGSPFRFRTMCFAPSAEFRRVLEEVRALGSTDPAKYLS